jgi:hypothetical protein
MPLALAFSRRLGFGFRATIHPAPDPAVHKTALASLQPSPRACRRQATRDLPGCLTYFRRRRLVEYRTAHAQTSLVVASCSQSRGGDAAVRVCTCRRQSCAHARMNVCMCATCARSGLTPAIDANPRLCILDIAAQSTCCGSWGSKNVMLSLVAIRAVRVVDRQ